MSDPAPSDVHYLDVKKRKLIAENVLTDQKILIELAKDSDIRVRQVVASNQACPLEALLALFWQSDYAVREAVASNPAVPSDFFVVVVRHPATEVLLRDKSTNMHLALIEPHGSAFSGVKEIAQRKLNPHSANYKNKGYELGWVPANQVSPPETLGQWAAEHPKTTVDTLAALAFGPAYRVLRWSTNSFPGLMRL